MDILRRKTEELSSRGNGSVRRQVERHFELNSYVG